MHVAEVGDDVYGEDPSINRLEEIAAGLTGMEDSLFLPSGTMGNLVAVLTHCGRGDGVVLGADSHILNNEGGGVSALGSISTLVADDSSGRILPEEVRKHIRPSNIHHVQARLLCLENTHNGRGGLALSPTSIRSSANTAHDFGLLVHIDGARIFNAAVAWGCSVKEFTGSADSLQFCLSKGLGAPVGSMLCGKHAFIEEAHFWRKRLGGALRQAGILAAAGLYALSHNIERLQEDHDNAALLSELLSKSDVFRVERNEKPTNMVYCTVPDGLCADLHLRCAARGVMMNGVSNNRFRLVTHLDVSRKQVARAAEIILEEAAVS